MSHHVLSTSPAFQAALLESMKLNKWMTDWQKVYRLCKSVFVARVFPKQNHVVAATLLIGPRVLRLTSRNSYLFVFIIIIIIIIHEHFMVFKVGVLFLIVFDTSPVLL